MMVADLSVMELDVILASNVTRKARLCQRIIIKVCITWVAFAATNPARGPAKVTSLHRVRSSLNGREHHVILSSMLKNLKTGVHKAKAADVGSYCDNAKQTEWIGSGI